MELVEVPRRLSPESLTQLRTRIDALPNDAVVVLKGPCEGLDLEHLIASDYDPEAAPFAQLADLLDALHRGTRPLLYTLDGVVFGGGVGLVAVADIVIATPHSSLSLPEVFLGLSPAAVLPSLIRRVGPAAARRMALGATAWSADVAHRAGLVDVVTDDLDRAADGWHRRLERASPQALSVVRRLTSGAGPDAAAIALNQALLRSADTRSRIARHAAGEAPWPTPDDP